jgi:tetratricopeptide (TPR) repeat protein
MAMTPERERVDSAPSMRFLPVVILLFALVGVALLSRSPERQRRVHQEPMLPRPEFLKVVGASQLPLLADYFWIQTIQTTGRARRSFEYRDVYFYADLATDLDPKFTAVYAFAGGAIPANIGRETWVNTEESTRLLEKGLPYYGDEYYPRILYAYNLSYFHKRYAEAAAILREASNLPGAPPYIARLATRLLAQAGEVDQALEFARSLLAVTEEPEAKEAMERRIVELQAERLLQEVDRAIAQFRERTDRLPTSMWELVGAGDLGQMPIDPLGGTVLIGEDGRAHSSAETRRLEVFLPKDTDP